MLPNRRRTVKRRLAGHKKIITTALTRLIGGTQNELLFTSGGARNGFLPFLRKTALSGVPANRGRRRLLPGPCAGSGISGSAAGCVRNWPQSLYPAPPHAGGCDNFAGALFYPRLDSGSWRHL